LLTFYFNDRQAHLEKFLCLHTFVRNLPNYGLVQAEIYGKDVTNDMITYYVLCKPLDWILYITKKTLKVHFPLPLSVTMV